MKVGDIVKVKFGFEADLFDRGLLGIVIGAYYNKAVPRVEVAWSHRTATYRVRCLELISESR